MSKYGIDALEYRIIDGGLTRKELKLYKLLLKVQIIVESLEERDKENESPPVIPASQGGFPSSQPCFPPNQGNFPQPYFQSQPLILPKPVCRRDLGIPRVDSPQLL